MHCCSRSRCHFLCRLPPDAWTPRTPTPLRLPSSLTPPAAAGGGTESRAGAVPAGTAAGLTWGCRRRSGAATAAGTSAQTAPGRRRARNGDLRAPGGGRAGWNRRHTPSRAEPGRAALQPHNRARRAPPRRQRPPTSPASRTCSPSCRRLPARCFEPGTCRRAPLRTRPGGQLPLSNPPSGPGEVDGPVLTGNCGPSARETVDGDPRPRASYCRTPGSPARRAAAGALPRLSPPRRPRPAVPGRALPRGAGKERACASARDDRRRERGRRCGRRAGPSHLRWRGGGLHLGQRPAPFSTGDSGP